MNNETNNSMNNVAAVETPKSLVEQFRNDSKLALDHLNRELTTKEHLLTCADVLGCSIMPKMINVFNLYGSIGSLNFETKDINDVLTLIETFKPLDLQHWINGCGYYKPVELLKDGEKGIQSATQWGGVMFTCDTFGQTFEWFTQHDDTVFRISIDVSPWGFGGKQMNRHLPTVWEKRKSDYDSNSRLLDWGVNNPRGMGNRMTKLSGGMGNSGKGRMLWHDVESCVIELEQLAMTMEDEKQC